MIIPKAKWVRHYSNPGWKELLFDEMNNQIYESLGDLIERIEDLESTQTVSGPVIDRIADAAHRTSTG
jgi:hypothetical protein